MCVLKFNTRQQVKLQKRFCKLIKVQIIDKDLRPLFISIELHAATWSIKGYTCFYSLLEGVWESSHSVSKQDGPQDRYMMVVGIGVKILDQILQ